MKNKLPNIKERILHLSEKVEVSKQEFFKKIDITYGNFTGEKKNRPVNSDAIENILLNYPQTNPEWLLTGNGNMLKDYSIKENATLNLNKPSIEYRNHTKNDSKPEGIPLLPFDAFAGSGYELMDGIDFDTIEERYEIPLFEGLQVDFMIPVRGSSMYPKYNSGDVVACRMIKELLFIQWNKVYVIDTLSQGVVMKRLKKSEHEDCIICKSDNKDYDEFELPKSEIRSIALVVGVVRLE